MTAHDAAAPPPASGRYVVILEGPDTRLLTEYATRAEAVLAIEQELARLDVIGATIAGDLASGYVARWWKRGQVVSMRITLGQVQ